MTKRSQREAVVEAKGQGGPQRIGALLAAGFGAMLVVSFLAPADAISVFVGTALPQNLGWLLLAVLAAFASRESLLQVRTSRAEIAVVLGGLVWLVAVTWLASGHGNGRGVWNGFWQVMSLVSCFYIARALLQFSQVRKVVIIVLLVGCTAMSFVGLEQVVVSLPATRAKYAENPEKVLAEYGFDAPPGSPRRAQFEDRLNSPEPFANFALANSLATLLCAGVILTGGLLASSIMRNGATSKDQTRWWIGMTGVSLALLAQLVCLLLTRSRTAYLSILVALACWLILEWMRGKVRLTSRTLSIAGLVAGALALVGFGWLLTVDRLVWSEAPKSISYRLEYWQATLAMIRDHAWIGVGLGNFQAYYPQYKLEQASEIVADPHNWVLDVAATLSVPIAVLAIGWIGVSVAKGIGACLVGSLHDRSQDAEAESQLGRIFARALILGALIGGTLSAMMLALVGNLDLPTNLVAWGLSGGLGWLAWQGQGAWKASAANLVAGLVAVVLCLLSSGSWQASGIAIPVMVLLAIHWQWSTTADLKEPFAKGERSSSWVATLVAITALTIFMLQTWRPVMQSWMLVESAAGGRSADERFRLFELAAAADPLDTERDMHKVQLLAAKANETSDAAGFTAEASRVMQELDRISPPNVVGFLIPKLAGEISSQLAAGAARRGLPNHEYLTAARGFYSLAVERYPSSVEMLLQHAAASALSEDWQSAEQSLEKACQISDQTPHLDKKIASQMLLLPLKPPIFEAQSDYVPAEPLVDWLRTEIKAKLR